MEYIEIIKWTLIAVLSIIILFDRVSIKKQNDNLNKIISTKEILYNVGYKVSKAECKQEVYSLILEAAIKLITRADKGSVLILEDDGYFHYKALHGYSSELYSVDLEPKEIFLYKVNNFKDTVVIENPLQFDENQIDKKKTEFLKKNNALQIAGSLSSPIYIDDKLIGIINVDSMEKNKIFTKDDVDTMNYIKNELQLALKNFIIADKLRYKANYDELTGLYNRRCFKKNLIRELERIKRYENQFTLALIDLDGFKQINDNYGHNQGDKTLKFFADKLRENIRKTDTYARMSGDEFVIIFINCNEEEANSRMKDLREIVINSRIDGIKIDFSYGLCNVTYKSDKTPDEIFGQADKAMYEDKKIKENRMQC